MSYSTNATAYRNREVQSASPARLLVMVFDFTLANLLRARHALKAGKIEDRAAAVAKARDGIMELLVTLDTERGGEIARNLKSLYGYILAELSEVVRQPDGGPLEPIITMVGDLRGAFESVANTDVARVPAA